MDFKSYFDKFDGKRILVIGDVMVDAYIRGKVNRVSPEAPVPIVSFDFKEDRLGGAGNVALNLVALGAIPVLCSVIGKDADAQTLTNLLTENQVSSEGLVSSFSRKTTVKTRVVGNNQQLLRIDSEQTDPITSDEEDKLIERVIDLIKNGRF